MVAKAEPGVEFAAPARSRRPEVGVDGTESVESPASLLRVVHDRPLPYSTDGELALRVITDTGRVAVDLETRGLHPHAREDAAIGAIILHAGDRSFIFRTFPRWWWDVLADENIQKIGHNLKFDLMWMISVHDEPVMARGLYDTMLMSQIVNRYRTKSGAAKAGLPDAWEPNDLASVLKRHLDVEIGKSIDHEVTDWAGEWSDEMIEYMLEDIEYLEPLADALQDKIVKEGQEHAAWIENESVLATAWMTYNGITPDQDAWLASAILWKEQLEHLLFHLRKKWPGVENFNSPQQLMKTLPDIVGAPVPNTAAKTLKQLQDHYYPVKLLMEQRHLQTQCKNWGPHFLRNHVCSSCGRFHPDWRQIGTETSRFSCSAPNLQQIPRATEFRRLFVAQEGSVLCSLDYSAIEVLVAAIYAGEKNLIEACATGDPHRYVAASVKGVPPENIAKDSPERQNGKIANFGLLYGGGAKGLIEQAASMFNVTLTEAQAQKIISAYFTLFPRLKRTKNEAYREMDAATKAIDVRNMIGFRRFLEGHNRRATSYLNTIMQSSAGHGLKASFRHLREAGLLPFLCMQVHDELVFEFPEEYAEQFSRVAKDCMIRGMRDILDRFYKDAPVLVEPKIARFWKK